MPGLLAWRLLLLLLAPNSKVDAGQLQIIAPFTQAMDKLWDDPLFPAQNHTMPTFQTHNFGCNITMLASLHASTGVPGVLSLEACGAIDSIGVWDYASALTRKNQTGLHPAWRENLDRLLDNTIPLFHTNPQILAGVFMGDEVLCDFVPFSNYSAVGEVVRKRLGAAGFIYGNECFRPFQDVGEVFSVGTTLPSFLNFISVDWYARCTPGAPGSPGANPHFEVQHLQTFVNTSLRPRLLPHQKILLVPGLFGDQNLSTAVGSGTISQQSKCLLVKLNGYYDWARRDPDVAGMVPWHWLTLTGTAYSQWAPHMELGIEAFPAVVSRLAQISAAEG